jgi:aminoglycoside/choline kinase family phosphotransferase
MTSARKEILDFVQSRYPGAGIRSMAGDASTRRFHRVVLENGEAVVLMDYGSPFEGPTDDMVLAEVFRKADLPVPRIIHVAPETGCLVLEDLGKRTLQEVLGPGGDLDLYGRAVRLAAEIAVRGTDSLQASDRADGPALDEERFRFEMDFFLEHYLAGLQGFRGPLDPVRGMLHDLARRAARTPRKVLCHRDFHSRNLVVRDDGGLAMVDFQDARWGPDTYDLASLLRDAYVDIDEGLVDRMIVEYTGLLPWNDDPVEFRRRFDTVSLQRMIKALGTFGYQAGALRRERYLEGVPRTVQRIRSLLDRFPEYERLPF